jgi:MFS family permease
VRPTIRYRDLVLLCLASAAASVGTTMLALLVPLLGIEYGLDAVGVGVVVSGAFVLPLLLAVATGRFVDRHGAKRVITLGLVAFGVALVPAVALPGLATLVVANVIASLGHLGSVVGSQTLVAELGRGAGRTAAYGWWTTSVSFGQLVGPLVAGVTLDVLPRTVAFVPALVSVVIAVVLVTAMRAAGTERDDGGAALTTQGSPARAIRDPVVLIAIVTSSAAVWAMVVFGTFFPLRLTELAVPATMIGALMSLRALAAVVVRSVMVPVVDRLGGRERTVVLTLLALGGGLLVLGASSTVTAFAAVCVVLGVAMGLSQPVSMVMVADRVAPRDRGAVLGLRLGGNRLAQLLAPVALVFMAETAGLPWLFVAHGALVLITAVVLASLIRSHRSSASSS